MGTSWSFGELSLLKGMQLGNTANSYGLFARALHWLTVLVILTAFPLGLLANGQDLTTDTGIQKAFLLFSVHKTTGILAFTLGVIRLFWTLSQPRPAPVHQDRPIENFVAAMVHWMLTIALIAVPLAGWISHSATSELAPIWWPFGQALPFVPKDPALAEGFGAIHRLFTKVLLAAVTLHIAGALKHLIFDNDAIFARMWRGTASGALTHNSQIKPISAAVVIWSAALTAGLLFGLAQSSQTSAEPREWPLADANVALLDGNGELLATATAYGFLLVLNTESRNAEKGTLDLTVPLDALDGPAVDAIINSAPFPLLQFIAIVSGDPPSLSATGAITVGNSQDQAELKVEIVPTGAKVTGTSPVPGLADAFLSINALALRP